MLKTNIALYKIKELTTTVPSMKTFTITSPHRARLVFSTLPTSTTTEFINDDAATSTTTETH